MSYICVVGGANVDITCQAKNKVNLHDSNIGVATYSFGGVARNIAENLARLGEKVVFVSAVGTDGNSRQMMKELDELGVDVSHVLTIDGECASTYVSINEGDDMFVGISSMDILQHLTPSYLQTMQDVLVGAKCIVTDTNLPHCLDYLNSLNVPTFIDGVSGVKTALAKNEMLFASCIKLNTVELSALVGKQLVSNEEVIENGLRLSQDGLKVIVTNGKNGAYAFDGEVHSANVFNVPVASVNGAGDSFFAGFISNYLGGATVNDSLTFGCGVGALTVMSKDTVNKELTRERVEQFIKENKA